MKRLRIHTSETAQGKVFVPFLSLIVRSYMLRQLKNHTLKPLYLLWTHMTPSSKNHSILRIPECS